jgi:putative aldouronate transport system substrate-binding protein
MFKMKKMLSLLLVAAFIVMMFAMTACEQKKEEQQDKVTTADEKETTAEEKETAAETTKEKEKELVQLIWYLRGDEPPRSGPVNVEVNKLIREKIKANVVFRYIPMADYNARMQLVTAAGEPFDLCYTSHFANHYDPNVRKGAFTALEPYLENHPDLYNSIPEKYWELVKSKGKIYAVPNIQVLAEYHGYWFKKDLVEKYDIDLSGIDNIRDITPILQKIKENEPDVIPTLAPEVVLFTPRYAATGYCGVNPETWKVIRNYSLDEYKENMPGVYDFYKTMREWYKKGYFPQDVATLKAPYNLVKTGKVFVGTHRMKPGGEADFANRYGGVETVFVQGQEKWASRNSLITTLTAVSRTSQNPDRAVDMLELVNLDKEVYNMLCIGIEGEDYKKVSDNRIEPIEGKYAFHAWQLGNQFNAYLLPGQPDDVWEITKKENEEAIIDPMTGFTPDISSIENEVAQVKAVGQEFSPILMKGLDDIDKTLEMQIEKSKAAGIKKIHDEIQKQLDEWKKGREDQLNEWAEAWKQRNK